MISQTESTLTGKSPAKELKFWMGCRKKLLPDWRAPYSEFVYKETPRAPKPPSLLPLAADTSAKQLKEPSAAFLASANVYRRKWRAAHNSPCPASCDRINLELMHKGKQKRLGMVAAGSSSRFDSDKGDVPNKKYYPTVTMGPGPSGPPVAMRESSAGRSVLNDLKNVFL